MHIIAIRILLLLLPFCTLEAFGQHLDVDFEGPWLFYLEPHFQTIDGTTKTVLVAIAPDVPGHRQPFFSNGDGYGEMDFGIYCVGFDEVCDANDISALSKDGYAKALPVDIYGTNFDWTAYASSTYAFILPMPDSYSSDGTFPTSFQKNLPTPQTPSITTEKGNHSIGAVLHYINGPQLLTLLGCSNPRDASTCQKLDQYDNLINSGTLRIAIKRTDETDPDTCRYHVHAAYHKMLHLVDPMVSNPKNGPKAYIDVEEFEQNCTPNDPQQDPMNHSMTSKSPVHFVPDIAKDLDKLVKSLESLQLPPQETELVALPKLFNFDRNLNGRIPRESQLIALLEILAQSRNGIQQLIDILSNQKNFDIRNRGVSNQSVKNKLQDALRDDKKITDEVIHTLSDLSGKDCRAFLMLIH